MTNSDWMKCRWCSYRVKKYTTDKNGERQSGWPKMRVHSAIEHPEEHERLMSSVGVSGDDE